MVGCLGPPPHHPYTEALTPNVMALGGGASRQLPGLSLARGPRRNHPAR